MRQPGIQIRPGAARRDAPQGAVPLHRQACLRFAQVAAARIERTAQRADAPLVGRAVRHVGRLVLALANDAALHAQALVGAGALLCPGRRLPAICPALGLARQVVAPLRGPGNERRCDKGRDQRHHGRERLQQRPEEANVRSDPQRRGQHHGTHAHRVDVVQVRALELDAFGRPPHGLVDDEVGHHRHDPGNGKVGVEPQHLPQRLEHVHLHEHERDEDVEHHPHNAPRVAVGEPREEVAPGQRTGVGVGHIDLELRHHHEDGGGRHRPAVRQDVLVCRQVHLVGVYRTLRRHHVRQRQPRQHGATQHFQHPHDHPARPARQHPGPPLPALSRARLGHEAQVVRLLPHLRDERNTDRESRTKKRPLEALSCSRFTTVVHQTLHHPRIEHQNGHIRHHHHHQPQRLRPHLEAADDRHPVGNQRYHHHRADEIPPGRRYAQRQFQRVGHDGGLQRKEDERERGVDERCDGGADVAKARAPGEQVHVEPVAGRIHADGPARQKNDQPGGQNGPEGVGKAVLHQQGGAHSLQNEEGGHAKRGVGHPPFRPLAKALRRVAQRVVFHGLAGHPAVVVAPHLHNALHRLCLGRLGARSRRADAVCGGGFVVHRLQGAAFMPPEGPRRHGGAVRYLLSLPPWN